MFLSFVTAVAVSATTLLSPVAAPAACGWQVTPITVPIGGTPADVVVTGTDGHGDYSGYEMLGGQDTQFLLWHQGQPEAQPSPGDSTLPVDQNSSGTVLLTALVDGQRQIFTYDGAHTGTGAFAPSARQRATTPRGPPPSTTAATSSAVPVAPPTGTPSRSCGRPCPPAQGRR
jgi:hypothetical protein